MYIREIRNYSGRNIFCHKPVVQIVVDAGDLANISTLQLAGFTEKLLGHFPGLKSHHCSRGYEGGFEERLLEGTFLPHIAEHLAIELQCMAGYEVSFGKTRVIEEPFLYCIVFEYIDEYSAADFGEAAVEIVSALARNQPANIEEHIQRLQRNVYYSALGPSTRAIRAEAAKRHIPVRRMGIESLLQLGYGKYLRYVEASLPDSTSCIAVELAKNKPMAKTVLKENHIPVPEGTTVSDFEEALFWAERLGYPVVVKPCDANQGKGVTANVGCEEELRRAYEFARTYSRQVMVEKYIPGRDYRVLVVGDQVAAVAERKPPFIIGDGIHSIVELLAMENNNPLRGMGHEKALSQIRFDSASRELLARSGLNETSIPATGQMVFLRENGNLSTGGSARDCTAEIHPHNRVLAVQAARAIGLEVAGVDMVCDDIAKPLNGAVIEINAAPGLRMHLYPSEGSPQNVAACILDYMYPQGTPASIPIASVTGTNGKTTVTRLMRHVLSLTGKVVGMTCSSGTYIGDECISKGDNTGPLSAGSLLNNRSVEVAVLETARGGIIRKGLGYDLADVGIIINISEDHLGLDGINTLNDLAFVKALVVEAVKPDGFAVLNADDRMAASLASRVECNLIYFSRDKQNILVKQHIIKGGLAVVEENGHICIYWQKSKLPLLAVDDIPITFSGRVPCNIENSLAAISGLFALGVPDHLIKTGLETFKPDPVTNAGRFNIFDMGDFQVLLDYAHNASGYHSVLQFVQDLNASRLVGIIGMPGDRMDEGIITVGTIAGRSFSKLYIKEDIDLRGRQPGEVADLLARGALQGGIPEKDIHIILSENDALETAIYHALPGDLIVMFYEEFEEAYHLIQQFAGENVVHPEMPGSNVFSLQEVLQ